MCVAEDLVETIAPYARAHAEKLPAVASPIQCDDDQARVLSRNPAAFQALWQREQAEAAAAATAGARSTTADDS